MLKSKFVVVNVQGLTPTELEEKMNDLHAQGYKRAFQSTIEWYQGKGEWGMVTFELDNTKADFNDFVDSPKTATLSLKRLEGITGLIGRAYAFVKGGPDYILEQELETAYYRLKNEFK